MDVSFSFQQDVFAWRSVDIVFRWIYSVCCCRQCYCYCFQLLIGWLIVLWTWSEAQVRVWRQCVRMRLGLRQTCAIDHSSLSNGSVSVKEQDLQNAGHCCYCCCCCCFILIRFAWCTWSILVCYAYTCVLQIAFHRICVDYCLDAIFCCRKCWAWTVERKTSYIDVEHMNVLAYAFCVLEATDSCDNVFQNKLLLVI